MRVVGGGGGDSGCRCRGGGGLSSSGSSLSSVPWLDVDVVIVVRRLVGGDGWHWRCALVVVHLWVADGRVVFVIALVVVALVASVSCVHW